MFGLCWREGCIEDATLEARVLVAATGFLVERGTGWTLEMHTSVQVCSAHASDEVTSILDAAAMDRIDAALQVARPGAVPLDWMSAEMLYVPIGVRS